MLVYVCTYQSEEVIARFVFSWSCWLRGHAKLWAVLLLAVIVGVAALCLNSTFVLAKSSREVWAWLGLASLRLSGLWLGVVCLAWVKHPFCFPDGRFA